MGLFSRMGEIINSNINAMLDRAEDPEKMVKLMIHEMEDTLTEVKSSAAEVVADRHRLQRDIRNEAARRDDWETKAHLAIEKGRDDLAREAAERKLDSERKVEEIRARLMEVDALVKQYQEDIGRLEEKLSNARNRQRALIATHKSAANRRAVEEKIYKLNTTGAFAKFETYEKKIDRMNAEAEVMSYGNNSLEKQFQELVQKDEVDAELARLKAKLKPEKSEPAPAKPEPVKAAGK